MANDTCKPDGFIEQYEFQVCSNEHSDYILCTFRYAHADNERRTSSISLMLPIGAAWAMADMVVDLVRDTMQGG